MTNNIFFLFLACCLFSPLSAMGASSPMVERHIFSPEPDATGSYKSPLTLQLEKELMFTGVIITSHGKWAMIREKGKETDVEIRGRHKEGDEIRGMVIRKIGSNFLVLAGEGKEVRLNLYHEGKPRPATPVGSETPRTSEKKRPPGTSPAFSESGTGATADTQKSPLPHESKTSARRSVENAGASPPTKNPFLDALKRAQTKDDSFPDDQPPNPFLE